MVIPNDTPDPYTFALSQVEPIQKPGGTVKIADSQTFTVSDQLAVAEVVVEVDGMRYAATHSPNKNQLLTSFSVTKGDACETTTSII